MGSTPSPGQPGAGWGIDLPKVLVQGFGWSHLLVVVLDWYIKTIVGSTAGMQCQAQDGFAALALVVNRQFPAGV